MSQGGGQNQRTVIGVVAPARRLPEEAAARVEACYASLFGDNAPIIRFHPQCFLSEGHFAGDDAARTEAFVQMANDPNVDAIWFARGGYGAGRLAAGVMDQLGPAARSKKYLGYSDLGILLAQLQRARIGAPAHGPMPIDVTRGGGEAAIERAMRWLVDGDESGLEASSRPDAPCLAFNITVLAHMIGTPAAPDVTGRILMLEDIGEYAYALDRSMFTIMTNAATQSIAGVMLGRVSDVPDNDPDFEKTPEEIVRYWCGRVGAPYLGRCDIGHDADNKIVVFG